MAPSWGGGAWGPPVAPSLLDPIEKDGIGYPSQNVEHFP